MSEADGALISHLDDLQARLSRVAALSAPVDVAVGSARSSPARALKKRAAHSPRPTSLVSPLASPALEGRAAYYQTRDVVPGRAKRRYEIPPRHEPPPGGSDTTRTPPSLHATHHHETRVGRVRTGRLFFSSPRPSFAARVADRQSSDQQLDEVTVGKQLDESPPRASKPFSPRQSTGTVTERPRRGDDRDDDPRSSKNANVAANVAELDATRARALAAESGLRAARGDVAVLAERLRLANEAEAAHAERVAAIVNEAERVALEATRASGTRVFAAAAADSPPRLSADGGADDGDATRFPLASRAAAARVAAAEARGEAARLVSALGADPELAKGLVRRLGEVSRLVADLAAAAEE
jgi:hypothetical protein